MARIVPVNRIVLPAVTVSGGVAATISGTGAIALPAITAAGSGSVSGGGATPFFTEPDFKTGYTWGSLPMTTQSTANTQLSGRWVADWSGSRGAIDAWPPDSSKNCYRITYEVSDSLDVLNHSFSPSHTNLTSRPTDIYVQWKEYRSSTFDFGPSKDWRIGIYNATSYEGSGSIVDVYGLFGNLSAAGSQSACTVANINIQGAGQSQPTGDPNVIVSTSFELTKGTAHTVEVHLKVNDPGSSNGAAEMWVDGVQIMSKTNVKITPDAFGQGYIDFFQLGMTTTNGGQAFSPTSYVYFTDIKIATGYIGT